MIRNRTYEKMYGKERAKEIKAKISRIGSKHSEETNFKREDWINYFKEKTFNGS